MPKTLHILTVAALATGLSGAALPAQASTAPPKKFANCKALNAAYKHGVGRKGAHDHVAKGSKPVTTFRVDDKLYRANAGLDRDKDGIACEKR